MKDGTVSKITSHAIMMAKVQIADSPELGTITGIYTASILEVM